jgi:hypothetical protein
VTRPGGFRKDWSIWCAAQLTESVKTAPKCPTWAHVEGNLHKQRAKFARKLGWCFVNGVGWLCPACHSVWKASR